MRPVITRPVRMCHPVAACAGETYLMVARLALRPLYDLMIQARAIRASQVSLKGEEDH